MWAPREIKPKFELPTESLPMLRLLPNVLTLSSHPFPPYTNERSEALNLWFEY
jgi:hypothetical protein